MISKKKKRKIAYEGITYYWYVLVSKHSHRVHILSEDKKVHLVYPFFDTELPVTPLEVRRHLREYHDKIIILSK